MRRWILAYANADTDYAWVEQEAVGVDDLAALRERAEALAAGELRESSLAIFADTTNTPWTQRRRPLAVYNRHIRALAASPRATLGGLINSLSSDWF